MIARIACIDPHQTGSVGEDSDHLQLIKFRAFCAPGNGVCGRAKFLAPPYYSQRIVFASLRALFSSSLLLQSSLLQIIIGRELCISYRVLVTTTAISIISDCSKLQKSSTFWYWLTQVVLQTGGKNKRDVVLSQISENGQIIIIVC